MQLNYKICSNIPKITDDAYKNKHKKGNHILIPMRFKDCALSTTPEQPCTNKLNKSIKIIHIINNSTSRSDL